MCVMTADRRGVRRWQAGQTSSIFFTNYVKILSLLPSSHTDAGGRIDGIFWTTEFRINLWKEIPEVLGYDATFRTNQYDMPLIQLTGTACLRAKYSLRWATVGGQLEEFHYWVLHDCILYLSLKYKISLPFVMVSGWYLA